MYLVFLVAISGGVERFVGVRRFANELNIAMSRTKRATKLRYIPTTTIRLYHKNHSLSTEKPKIISLVLLNLCFYVVEMIYKHRVINTCYNIEQTINIFYYCTLGNEVINKHNKAVVETVHIENYNGCGNAV